MTYKTEKMMIKSRDMRSLEINSEYFGVSRLQLMENAGRSVAAEIATRFKRDKTRVAVFCGLGGNGGDGFVAARHLACLGFRVDVVLAGRSSDIKNETARRNRRALEPLAGTIALHEVHDSTLIPRINADVLVDALLGVGVKGSLRPPISQLVKKINEMKAYRVSVDAPTGIDSDCGEVLDEAVRADLTITFHKIKPGLVKAADCTGELIVRDIGLPAEFERFAGPGDVSLVHKPRRPGAHKGDFGKLLVIGGSEVFSGAPSLVALAALRTGVDVTYIAAPHETAHAISSMSPNLITIKLQGKHLNPKNMAVIKWYLEATTGVVLGPGLGVHEDTIKAVEEIVETVEETNTPLLLDADGVKSFAESRRKLSSPLVFTPHAGEYRILAKKEPPKELKKRVTDVQNLAKELGGVVLLKGHTDVVSDGERVKLNFTGNPGMTVGGTGDVLSGVVGALLAQQVDPFEAAVAGAFINGAAGDFAQSEKGNHIFATDIIEWIPHVMNDPMSHLEVQRSVF